MSTCGSCCTKVFFRKESSCIRKQTSDVNIIIEQNAGRSLWLYHLKRYFALTLWCVIGTGLIVCYDLPGSLQNHIMKQYNIGPYEFSYIYSAYCWPNCVMCLFSGFFIDRFLGVKIGVILYMITAVVGQIVVFIGSFKEDFYVLLLGRFIYGVGSEACLAGLNNYAVLWFKGKELNMVLSTLLNVARIGSSITFEVSEPTYHAVERLVSNKDVLNYTIIILGSTIAIPLICSVIASALNPDDAIDKPEQHTSEQTQKQKNDNIPKISDFLHFPLKFWLLQVYGGVLLSSCYSFTSQAQALFTEKFKISNEMANRYVSFFNIFGAALSPCLGYSIDKFGRNLSYLFLSSITGSIGYALVAFTQASPFITMVILAVAMTSVFGANWGMYSLIIPEHQLGTAFGIAQCGMNLSLSLGTVLAGAIADRFGFEAMNLFFMLIIIAVSPLVIWCWILDSRSNGILNMSAKARLAHINRQKMSERTDTHDVKCNGETTF